MPWRSGTLIRVLVAVGILALSSVSLSKPSRLASEGAVCFTAGLENMPEGTPRLYGYEHSHYTVRCRMALGLKRVPYRMTWVAEDDEETPMRLVGKKITPIIEFPGEKAMPESSDIIERVEANEAWGPRMLKEQTDRPELDAWVKTLSVPMRNLGRPRYIRSAVLPEFHSASARARFVTTHPLPDPVTGETLSKADWAALPKEKRDAVYQHYWDDSEAQLAKLNSALAALDDKLIASDGHVSSHGLSWDDIVFFSRLRGLTMIRGIQMPSSLEAYLETMSEKTDIPLLSQLAL